MLLACDCGNAGSTGSCNENGVCFCKPGFTGTNCETSVCKVGWTDINGRCYKKSDPDESATWEKAQEACEDMGGILAEPKSELEDESITGLGTNGIHWIGISDQKKESR